MYIFADYPGWIKCPACSFCKKELKSMIDIKEILGGTKLDELSPELQTNVSDLLVKLNKFRTEYGHPMIVNSGYRDPAHNDAIGGAKNSAHCMCQAADFRDEDGKIFEFIKNDPKILERCGLFMEDAEWTPTWIHLQSREIASGNRIFVPYRDKPPVDKTRKI
jgi:hypothetical protein